MFFVDYFIMVYLVYREKNDLHTRFVFKFYISVAGTKKVCFICTSAFFCVIDAFPESEIKNKARLPSHLFSAYVFFDIEALSPQAINMNTDQVCFSFLKSSRRDLTNPKLFQQTQDNNTRNKRPHSGKQRFFSQFKESS